VIRYIAPLVAIVIVVAGSGCGSDESGEDTAPTVSIPAITSPLGTTTAGPVTTSPPGATSTTNGGKTYDPNVPDSETNDVPPPPGSPQEAFEKACEQNPEACG
jgi:hypothetical protein